VEWLTDTFKTVTVKTLYFQWALIDLSRMMLYASIPALLTAIAGILYLDPALFPGTVFGVRTLVMVVSAGVAVSLLPFAFLWRAENTIA
jgi:hypothetical protein